jgi:hypothetical protein
MADSLNAHRESNETNNALALNLTVAAPAPDSDSDGLDDLSEAAVGTDSTNAASVLGFTRTATRDRASSNLHAYRMTRDQNI